MNNAMRFPTSSSLLCKHTISARTWGIQRIPIASSRAASSLSAIHHGLRQSEKSRPQGFNKSSLETAKSRRPPRDSSRDKGPGFKIRKGKKDITYTGPGRPTRKKRFNDPNDSFGKKSLVFQMKNGMLRDKLAELEGLEPSRTPSSSRRDRNTPMSSDDFMKNFNDGSDGFTKSFKDDRNGRRSARKPTARGSRTDSFGGVRGRGSDRESTRPASDSRPFDRQRGTNTGVVPKFSDKFNSPRERDAREPAPDAKSFDRQRGTGTGDVSKYSDKFKSPREWDTRKPAPEAKSFDRQRGTSTGDVAKYSDKFKVPRERDATRPAPDASRFDRQPRSNSEDGDKFSSKFSSRREPSENAVGWGKERLGGEIQDAHKEPRRSRDDDAPIRIHHTTAASQFLYGRSVVEAALKASRRQLYKMYIYNGDDRQNIPQDEALERLGRLKGVQVVKVPNGNLRMLDKMSGGRPHNGCVLEASPLPQLPLKALGGLSENPAEAGFHVEMAYQSAEEAKVNGTSDFVPYHLPPGRHPFVLLLDGILDPGNLGAILRTAAFLGVNGIAITKASSATLTAIALKASAGASEVATLFSVSSTRDFIERSKANGWLTYAAVPATKRARSNSHLTIDRVETFDPLASQPTLLVIGSEGEGLDKVTRRLADHEVSIPSPAGSLTQIVDSLNVSVATGVLCAGFLKRQSAGLMEVDDMPYKTTGDDEAHLW